MRLQDRLPDGVMVDGTFYKMDFDFRNVFRMLDVLDEENMLPEAKAYKALKCLCKRPRNVCKTLQAVKEVLFTAPRKAGEKITDFVQDAGLIRAAFRQAYGIDLYREKLHWIEFTELLSAIPEGSRYTEVLGIRARPVPVPTKYNQEQRASLIKAKADVALKMTEKEQATKYQRDVAKVAEMLMVMAGGEDNGK